MLDGTLRGASIGASNVEWRTVRREGREVPVARRYDLVELSLVDLPSNPDALGVTFVRDGVPVAEVLDELEESSPPTPGSSPPAPLLARHGETASRGGGTDRTAEDTEIAESGPGPAGETVEQRGGPLPQPLPVRVADKTHALLPHGGQSGVAEQMRALEGLAGRLTDPQAQIAVATEMIRLQQEAGAR